MNQPEQLLSPDDQGLVPTELPGMRTDTPATVRPISLALLPLAAIAYWFMPRRMGVRLAAAGWVAAIVTAFVGVMVGASLVAFSFLAGYSRQYGITGVFLFTVEAPATQMTASEAVRAPFASLVTLVHSLSSAAVAGWTAIAAFTILPIAATLLIAFVLMRFTAEGEHVGPLYGRCLRLTLWSFSMLIPFGLGWLFLPAILSVLGVAVVVPPPASFGEPLDATDPMRAYAMSAIGLFVFWWLIVLVRGGDCYGGPPLGPGWRKHTPRCKQCQYIISGIPVASKCPECGLAVADSLEAARHRLRFSRSNAFRQAIVAAIKKSEAQESQ